MVFVFKRLVLFQRVRFRWSFPSSLHEENKSSTIIIQQHVPY